MGAWLAYYKVSWNKDYVALFKIRLEASPRIESQSEYLKCITNRDTNLSSNYMQCGFSDPPFQKIHTNTSFLLKLRVSFASALG